MGGTDMTLTKIKLQSGEYDYFNLNNVQFVDKLETHFEVYFGSSVVMNVALDDPTISAAVSSADTA